MHYLVKKIYSERSNLLSIGSTTVVGVFSSLFMMLAFANMLEPEALGIYQYLLAISSIIASISLTGTNAAIVRAAGQKNYTFFPIAFRYTLLSYIPAAIIGSMTAGYYLYQGNATLASGIAIAVSLVLTLQYFLRYGYVFIGIEEFKTSNYLLKAVALGPLFFLLPALFVVQDPVILTGLYFGGSLVLVLVLICFLQIPKRVSELVETSAKQVTNYKSLLAFSVHQSVIGVLNSGTAHVDKIMIFQLLGAQATATYFIAVSIPNKIRSIIKQFEPFLFSKFAKYNAAATVDGLGFKFFLMLIGIVPIYILYILLAPLFFTSFVSQYPEAATLTLIYALTMFGSAAIVPYSQMKAHSSSRAFYVYTLICSFTKISFLFVGIYYLQLQGAIIASTCSVIINTLLAYSMVIINRNQTKL